MLDNMIDRVMKYIWPQTDANALQAPLHSPRDRDLELADFESGHRGLVSPPSDTIAGSETKRSLWADLPSRSCLPSRPTLSVVGISALLVGSGYQALSARALVHASREGATHLLASPIALDDDRCRTLLEQSCAAEKRAAMQMQQLGLSAACSHDEHEAAEAAVRALAAKKQADDKIREAGCNNTEIHSGFLDNDVDTPFLADATATEKVRRSLALTLAIPKVLKTYVESFVRQTMQGRAEQTLSTFSENVENVAAVKTFADKMTERYQAEADAQGEDVPADYADCSGALSHETIGV